MAGRNLLWWRKKPKRVLRVKRALLKIGGEPIEVILRSDPRAQRFIVKVDPSTREVSVVSPSARSFEQALEFARKERDWIAGRLADVPKPVPLHYGAALLYRGVEHIVRQGEKGAAPVWVDRDSDRPIIRVTGKSEHAGRRITDWLKREAKRRIEERVTHYAAVLEVKPRRVTIRDTTTRWGSCSSTRNLSFSWRLILAPPAVLDYVVAHEVAHLRELNHKPRFWRLVDTLVSDAARQQAWLSENGPMLHRYAPRNRENA